LLAVIFFSTLAAMMRVSSFFISLFFVLLVGKTNSFAGSSFPNQHCSSSQHFRYLETFGDSNSFFDKNVLTNFSFPEDFKILICEEVEEPDSNDSSSGKNRLTNGFYANFYDQCRIVFLNNSAKPLPFLWRNTSHRYILQRTLRI